MLSCGLSLSSVSTQRRCISQRETGCTDTPFDSFRLNEVNNKSSHPIHLFYSVGSSGYSGIFASIAWDTLFSKVKRPMSNVGRSIGRTLSYRGIGSNAHGHSQISLVVRNRTELEQDETRYRNLEVGAHRSKGDCPLSYTVRNTGDTQNVDIRRGRLF
jgi:hypothetical protein